MAHDMGKQYILQLLGDASTRIAELEGQVAARERQVPCQHEREAPLGVEELKHALKKIKTLEGALLRKEKRLSDVYRSYNNLKNDVASRSAGAFSSHTQSVREDLYIMEEDAERPHAGTERALKRVKRERIDEAKEGSPAPVSQDLIVWQPVYSPTRFPLSPTPANEAETALQQGKKSRPGRKPRKVWSQEEKQARNAAKKQRKRDRNVQKAQAAADAILAAHGMPAVYTLPPVAMPAAETMPAASTMAQRLIREVRKENLDREKEKEAQRLSRELRSENRNRKRECEMKEQKRQEQNLTKAEQKRKISKEDVIELD